MPLSVNLACLKSKNIHNFRHEKENPVILSVNIVKPSEELEERACYRVLYLNDNKVDFIPVSSVENGDWEFCSYDDRTDTK